MAIKKFDKADLNKDGKVTVQEQILAAIAPVILKALSPSNKEFGFTSK